MTDSTIKHIVTTFPITAEALKTEPRFHRRRSIIRDFSLNTTTHGIPGIARSKSIHNRLFWTLCSLIFAGIMIFFITQSIRAYFGYPTQTSVSFAVERSQAFPAVSFCNFAPIRMDKFLGPFLNYTDSFNVPRSNVTGAITQHQAFYIRDFLQIIFNSNESPVKYLFALENMLLECIYNGAKCSSADFISFISSTYGNCFTFNARRKSNGSRIRQTTDSGGSGNLQLRLYAHSQQYVPYVSDDTSSGMVMMVHDNAELPLIEVAGIQLAPGRRHKLGYKKRTSQLLSSPYSQCTTTIPPAMQAMFDRFVGADYAYSPIICNSICTQTYVYHECGCVNPYQLTTRIIVRPGTNEIFTAPLCNQTDPCYANATDRITNTDPIWDLFCSECLQECSTVDFAVTPSAVSAPSVEFAYRYKSAVESSGVPTSTTWPDSLLTDMQKNYVSVDIVAASTRVEVYNEDPSISLVDLISNVGGQTGLWVGMSFLSVMELVEMLYRLMRYHCHCLGRRVRGVDDTRL